MESWAARSATVYQWPPFPANQGDQAGQLRQDVAHQFVAVEFDTKLVLRKHGQLHDAEGIEDIGSTDHLRIESSRVARFFSNVISRNLGFATQMDTSVQS